jgi:hypothetical protein
MEEDQICCRGGEDLAAKSAEIAYPQKRLTVRGKALRSAHEAVEFCLAVVLVQWLPAEA